MIKMKLIRISEDSIHSVEIIQLIFLIKTMGSHLDMTQIQYYASKGNVFIHTEIFWRRGFIYCQKIMKKQSTYQMLLLRC